MGRARGMMFKDLERREENCGVLPIRNGGR